MKKYAVTLTGHYEKTISVYADTPEQAAEKVKIILFDTDLISFSEEDFVCGEAKIEDADKEECMNHEDCSGCPYLCPACGECLCEYED